jgi:hypothetical protein
MYIQRYAYFCDAGGDRERCLSGDPQPGGAGWEQARDRLGNKRVAAAAARSAVLATAAALRCLEGYEAQGGIEQLPLFVACGTGVGFPAHWLDALAKLPASDRGLEDAVFSGGAPSVIECLRYSSTVLAGVIAQMTQIRGENRTLSGRGAGLLALHQAERFLKSGRASEVLVVCGESLIEWAPAGRAPGLPTPREIGCALLLTRQPHDVCARVDLHEKADTGLVPLPFRHFEAANSHAALCWALEQQQRGHHLFSEPDSRGRPCLYGITRMLEAEPCHGSL